MPTPALFARDPQTHEVSADVHVIVLPSSDSRDWDLTPWPGLSDRLAALSFTGAAGSLVRVPLDGHESALAVVGCGSSPAPADYRLAAGQAARTVTGAARLAFWTPAEDSDAVGSAVLEGAALGGYVFDSYKTTGRTVRADTVVLARDLAAETVAEARVRAEAVALVKDLVSTPADRLGPADLADRARDEVRDLPIDVKVLDEHELEAQGYGGILGVGRGSDRPPRLVRLDYRPDSPQAHVALVGKGITFDTGGLSLKPAASMVGMKYDMCGAAVVLSVVRAAAQLALPQRVMAYLCIADNMPSGRATRPGDVLTMLDGSTVEVLNTDAEGRLVLADGLVAASREEPDVVVDVATLTGAITVALGTRHMGVMGTDQACSDFLDAATAVAEPAWRMPLPDHMRDELDSPIADLVNAKVGDPAGGSLFAGLFLEHFVGRTADGATLPWVHLDIAGVGMNKGGGYGFTDKGPTGASVRALISFVAAASRNL